MKTDEPNIRAIEYIKILIDPKGETDSNTIIKVKREILTPHF